jgi:hypothetical protein
MRKQLLVLLMIPLLACALATRASAITLADLLPGGGTPSVTVGNLTFSNFSNFSPGPPYPAPNVDPSTITVTPFISGNSVGISFSSPQFSVANYSPSSATFTDPNGVMQDTAFDFNVSVTGGDPRLQIVTSSLTMAATVQVASPPGPPTQVVIDESAVAATAPHATLAANHVEDTIASFTIVDLIDSETLSATTRGLNISKNISLNVADNADVGNASAQLTSFTESFDTAIVPEPASWALMVLGLPALLLALMQRRHARR